MKNILFICILLFFSSKPCFAQEDELKTTLVAKDSLVLKPYNPDPLAPSKAAFASAVAPGLGQIYNKKYWKLPIIYGGMGLSLYYYSWNNTKYHEYRDAYKNKLANRPVTGELAELDADRLIRGQKFHQKNRDLSLLITFGIYLLNILDANIDAHLKQFNVDENLSLRPQLQQNEIDNKHHLGLTFSYQF